MAIVGRTVTQLAAMTQGNATSAKESSEAAEEMAQQTDELSTLVARFELNLETDGEVQMEEWEGEAGRAGSLCRGSRPYEL